MDRHLGNRARRDVGRGATGDRHRILQSRARSLFHELVATRHRCARFGPFLRLVSDGAYVPGVCRSRKRRTGCESGVPLLYSATGGLALLLRVHERVRGGAGENPDRSELPQLRLRNAERVLHRGAGHRDRCVPRRNDPGLQGVEPARRFQPSLYGRPGNPRAHARQGLCARGLRPGRGGHVHTRRDEGRHVSASLRLFAVRARLRWRRGDRHAVPRRRSRADARARSVGCQPSDRRLAAGSLGRRRRRRQPDGRFFRRRAHMVANPGPDDAVHRRQCGQRRRLSTRQRPMGHDRARRRRLSDRDRLRRRIVPTQFVRRRAGKPLCGRRAHLGCRDDADP